MKQETNELIARVMNLIFKKDCYDCVSCCRGIKENHCNNPKITGWRSMYFEKAWCMCPYFKKVAK